MVNLYDNFKERLKHVPILIAGVSLGFMSISTAMVQYRLGWVRAIAAIFSLICILILILKAIYHTRQVIDEIKSPFLGSIYPTVFMTLMLVSLYLAEINKSLAVILWIVSTILHVINLVVFVVFNLRKLRIADIIPSWFLPTVGIGLAAVTSKPMGMHYFSVVIFCFASISFIVIYPFMIYRIIKMEAISGTKLPTLIIMVVPSSICFSGYFSVVEKPNFIFVSVLAVVSYATLFYGYTKLRVLVKLPFSPSLSPITFPLGINVIASQQYENYLAKINSPIVKVAHEILYIQLSVALLIIFYVIVNTVIFMYDNFKIHKDKDEVKTVSN